MLTNESVTLYHYDEENDSFSRSFFPRASVYRNILASVADSGLVMDSVIKIRIPLDGGNSSGGGGSAQSRTAAGSFNAAASAGGAAGSSAPKATADGVAAEGVRSRDAVGSAVSGRNADGAMDNKDSLGFAGGNGNGASCPEDSAGHAEGRAVISGTTAERRAGADGENAEHVEADEYAAINGNVMLNYAGAANRVGAVNCTGAAIDGNAAGGYGAWNGAEAVSRKATVSSAGAGSSASLRGGTPPDGGTSAGGNTPNGGAETQTAAIGNAAAVCLEDSAGHAEGRAIISATAAESRAGADGENAEPGSRAADSNGTAANSTRAGAAGGNTECVEADEYATINGNVMLNHAGAANRVDAVNCTGASIGNDAGSRAGNGVLQGVLVDVGDYVFIGKSDESKPDRASCHKVLGFSQNLRGVNPHIRIEAK